MSTDTLNLSAEPIDSMTIGTTASPHAGGICTFLGTTRAERRADGVELLALDYEAYEEMAGEQLRALARRARERWAIEYIRIVHRVGRVHVGEPSVVIEVATPHRAEAFAACQWLIDTLKAEVTIWKKEIWADDSASWKNPETKEPQMDKDGRR